MGRTADGRAHSWVILQKPAKNEIQKFVKLTDRTYACNDLTNFEGEPQVLTGNGSYVNMLKLACKNSLNKIKLMYFSAGFSQWESLWGAASGWSRAARAAVASADLSQPRSPYAPGAALARAAAYYLHKLGVNGW